MAVADAHLTATVLLTTRNRRDDLRTALRSVTAQTEAIDIVVIDDGSTDGTTQMVATEFPQARLVRHEDSRGLVARRNEGMRLAKGQVVISIDDDAAFSTPDIVRQTLDDFSAPRIGAVAIPYVNINFDSRVHQSAPDRAAAYGTGRYIGTAHAVRVEVFQQLGGYREDLTHQGEEGDLCIRMLDAGYVVRLGTADPIHHFESPKRDLSRMDYYGVRNAIRFVWQNVPHPFLVPHLAVVTFRVMVLTFVPSRLGSRLAGLRDGFKDVMATARTPVSRHTYRLWRRLERGPLPIDQLA